MKVEVELKVTILEGSDKGETFTSKTIEETETEYGKPHFCIKPDAKYLGIPMMEYLKLEWTHCHNELISIEKEI